VWLVGGKCAEFYNNGCDPDCNYRKYGFSGRLLKN
jgi:hypothetical protein